MTRLFSDSIYASAIHSGMARSEPDLVTVGLNNIKNVAWLQYKAPLWVTELTSIPCNIYNEDTIHLVTRHEKNLDAVGLAFLSMWGDETIELLDFTYPVSRYEMHLYSAAHFLNNLEDYNTQLIKINTSNMVFEDPPWWIFHPGTSIGNAAVKRYCREYGSRYTEVVCLFEVFERFPIMDKHYYYNRYIIKVLETTFDTDFAWCQNLWEEYIKPKYKEYVEDIIHEF